MDDNNRKKHVVHLAEDGLPKADVSYYAATAEHLSSYDRAADELYKFKVPALYDAQDRHSYLLIGLMDGTGNDVAKDPLHATNVAKFNDEVLNLRRSGHKRIFVEYEAGPGTQESILAKNIDAATGRSSESIAERTYQSLVDRAQKIYKIDPDAKIAIHAEGFSRGASQVPLLAQMIHDRGIPNLYRPEYVQDEHGTLTKAYPHFHQAPGYTPMSVGLYDPVPTGAMEKLDRRLPPSVVSGFQINAADEKRTKFPVDRIIPQGMSEDGRFLSVSVAGAHSDIGGSYLRNGLGTRSQNLMTDYHNALFSEPLLRRLPETYDPRLNVIHRSEEGSIFKYMPKTQRDLPAGEVTKLVPDDGSPKPTDPVVAATLHRPKPMAATVAELAQGATPVVRAVPEQMAAPPAEEAIAEWHRKVGNVEVRPYQPPMQLSPGAKVAAAAGVAGIAASVVDAKASADRASTLLSQDNPLAAQSELTHYAARGTGGWIGGASAGLVATAAATGPGVVGFIVIGGAAVAGSHVGEHVATVLDSYKTFKQTDRQGVHWASNGLQWVRQDLGDMLDDGQNKPVVQTFSADPEKAEELSYRASNSATELAMGKLDPPRNPYSLPAADNDPVSLRRADWERNPQSGAWDRRVVVGFEQAGVPMYRIDHASPERVAELDRASDQVIRDNIANGPAPMAARYQMVHRSAGWERFGAMPPSVQSALQDNALMASDGKLYFRDAQGQWQRDGQPAVVEANLRQELESTRAALQPQLALHQQQVAEIPKRQPPTLEDVERADLLATYRVHKLDPSPEQLEASLEAVRRTQQEHGVAPLATSLHLGLNAHGKFDIDSPIEHIGRDADGANRVHAVTSPLEVQLAMLDLRSPPPTAPDPPELRIANLSPQQHEALEQVVREANRLGLKRDDVQSAAKQAVAGAIAADRAPELALDLADADSERLPRLPQAPRDSSAPSPAATKSPVAALASERPEEPRNPQGEGERTKAESLAGVRPVAASSADSLVAPPVREAQPTRAMTEPAPTDGVATKPPEPYAAKPQPAPAPDAPAQLEPQVAPPVVPPAVEAALDDTALRRGDRGHDVEMLQFRLQRVGYGGGEGDPTPEPGHFDATTEQAVRRLQRDHGLPDTGRVDPDTVQALAIAQQARIELQKTARPDNEALTPEKTPKPMEPALAVRDERVAEPAAASIPAPPPDTRPNQTATATATGRAEPSRAAGETHSNQREPPYARNDEAVGRAIPERSAAAQDLSHLSPADKAMFAKIRGNVSAEVPDETVAAAMLAAKRNGIPDAESIGPVGVANGKLWVGSNIPGFHTGVSISEPAPAMRDTVRETQAFNQQRDRQLVEAQQQPDEQQRSARSM
ncbi:phospholipase effector Tle1 domain-containing protein [Lysobacter sp. CA196]|uniref:phospholipase effector Tle1 domain-containing protein n=1 Tax=Lysobacter sp. CA196 TaxID=3455606 RepID=UPI003F8D570F